MGEVDGGARLHIIVTDSRGTLLQDQINKVDSPYTSFIRVVPKSGATLEDIAQIAIGQAKAKGPKMATSTPIVVSASWLKSALDAKTENLVVLDATWIPQVIMEGVPQTTGIKLYEMKHIPGARHFDIDACITKTRLIPRNLPEPSEFQAYLRCLGISDNSHVIMYDRDDGKFVQTAAAPRSCFILKLYGHCSVAVLDGGLLNWEALGYETQSGPPPSPQPGGFTVRYQRDMIVDFDTMKKIEMSGSHQIVDLRLPENFSGEEEEPCLFIKLIILESKFPVPNVGEVKQGHMENAVNIPFTSVFKEDSVSFKSKEDLQTLFRNKGLDLTKPTVATCYMGHTAAMMAILASYCGYDTMKLCYGSWTEYGQRSACA